MSWKTTGSAFGQERKNITVYVRNTQKAVGFDEEGIKESLGVTN